MFSSLCISSCGSMVAAGTVKGRIRVWNVRIDHLGASGKILEYAAELSLPQDLPFIHKAEVIDFLLYDIRQLLHVFCR